MSDSQELYPQLTDQQRRARSELQNTSYHGSQELDGLNKREAAASEAPATIIRDGSPEYEEAMLAQLKELDRPTVDTSGPQEVVRSLLKEIDWGVPTDALPTTKAPTEVGRGPKINTHEKGK